MFVARYLDLFFRYISLYNTIMKLFFIASSCYILFLMNVKYRYVLHVYQLHTFAIPPPDVSAVYCSF